MAVTVAMEMNRRLSQCQQMLDIISNIYRKKKVSGLSCALMTQSSDNKTCLKCYIYAPYLGRHAVIVHVQT